LSGSASVPKLELGVENIAANGASLAADRSIARVSMGVGT
jgi:hypothetical protein